jgi:hypothetical protein
MALIGKIKQSWFSPLFATLLQDRRIGLLLLGAGGLQLGLNLIGLPGWICPIKAVLGIPCPGCGLSTAITELLRGDWQQSLSTHIFAPIFLLASAILLAVTLLPEKGRQTTVSAMAAFEKRTGISALVLISLLVYWCVRLSGLLKAG